MAKETIIINPGNQSHEIELKNLNIIVPGSDMSCSRISYPKRLELSVHETIYHAERVQKLHDEFYDFWQYFRARCNPKDHNAGKPTPDEFRQMGKGALHILGMIDMMLKLQDKGIPLALKYPESLLHPGWCVGLGDLVWALAERSNGRNIVTKAE